MSGWIKLYRNINKHWIWENSDYLKWWLDMILEANYEDSKVVIKNKIYECKRGEKLYSLDTWAIRWKTNKSKVRRFFYLLQNDNMIRLVNETQTTRVTICNYESYQDEVKNVETQTKRKRNGSETHLTPIKEIKNNKENNIDMRKLKFADTLKPFLSIYGKDMLNDFYLYWTEPNKSNTKFRQEMEKTWNLERRLLTWANNESKYGKPKANLSYSEMNLEQLQNHVSEVVIAERLYNNMEVIPPELKGYFDKMCKRLAQFIKANIDTVKNKSIADIMALEKKSNIGKL